MSEARERRLEETLRRVVDLHFAYANRPSETHVGLSVFIKTQISPILLEVDARKKDELYVANQRIVQLEQQINKLIVPNS